MNKLWTRKNALEEVRKTLEEQKEDRWIKKMEELKEERRKRKDNDSPIRHNFTEKIKSELQNWNYSKNAHKQHVAWDKARKITEAAERKHKNDEELRERKIKILSYWDDHRERRQLIIDAIMKVRNG